MPFTFFFILVLFFGGLFWFAVLAWWLARVFLRGADLSAFDEPTGEHFASAPQPNAELQGVLARLSHMGRAARAAPRRGRTAVLRELMDKLSGERAFNARFAPADCAGVPAEWVLAPEADAQRRLLYIHGGAFALGSPKSHRTLTTALSAQAGAAVLAIDYRLMPEHPRMAGVQDCRTAYRWMLEHGPDGAQPASAVFVAGDSAGGSLALALIAWVRDAGLRAPDAAVALSPATDGTLGSPSLRANARTDPMLGPSLAPLVKLPRTTLLWLARLQNRVNPRNPAISPVYGNLSGLPPVLVQVSDSEMLRDDARRYVNRARAAGSPVRLQTWDNMIHVWQLFNPELPEARQALDEMGKFLRAAAPPRRDVGSEQDAKKLSVQ